MANEGHFYTTSITEANGAIENAGYQAEGVECFVFTEPNAVPGLVPVHRFYNDDGVDHFYCTDDREQGCYEGAISAGYTYENIAFYVLTRFGLPISQDLKWVPLYEMWSQEHSDHFYTTSQDRSFALSVGFVDVGVVGYVLAEPPVAPLMAAPLFRSYKPGDSGSSLLKKIGNAFWRGLVISGELFTLVLVAAQGGYVTTTDENGIERIGKIPPVGE